MKRSTIRLVKTFGSAALSKVRMNLLASHSRMILSLALLAIMMLAPSKMRSAVTTYDFADAAASQQYYASSTVVNMGEDYSTIPGAKKGDIITYRKTSGDGPNNKSLDISRFAFAYNSSTAYNTTDGSGFYLYAERISGTWYRGLYTGQWNTKLAVLNLKPGDKVTFNYVGSTESGNNANLHNDTYDVWMTQISSGQTASVTVDITFIGDLIVSANRGTIIQSISIESDIAEYDISTSADGKESTFVFTKDGLLENNDFTLPNLSVSFGSIYDFLVVQNYESHMYKTDGTENLTTDPTHNFQPSAGSFYCFKPTAGGTIKIEGSLQGSVMHLFVYDPSAGANGTGDWVGRNGNIFYDTFTSGTYQFTATKGLIYYICQNNQTENGNAFHLNKFTFTTTYYVKDLGVIINDVDNYNSEGHPIQLTKTEGLGGYELKVKRCTANIKPSSLTAVIDQYGWLYMSKPEFEEGTDHAGTVIWDLHADNGDDAIVVTFPYHADYNPSGYTDTNRTYGHTWNFIDPRNSDSNIGNCLIRTGLASFNTGSTEGILSIGQNKDTSSQFYQETLNREWTYSQRQTGQSGGFHDPYFANVWDMVGDNADMIWETEGLWFDTGSNLSCIYNENDAVDDPFTTNPLNFTSPGSADPDRYVGLLPVSDDKHSQFTIPSLKDGDRVLIFMKSGEGSGANGIFLNIIGAKDALGKKIETVDTDADTWYKAGGTNWQHSRYEGCYHFIKDGDGDMTFDMQSGSMCKLLYIRIYTGQRISTNNLTSDAGAEDSGRLLFMNDKGKTVGSDEEATPIGSDGKGSKMSLRFRGKGQQQKANVLTCSGNLNYQLSINKDHEGDVADSHFSVSGNYSETINFKSKVGEIGMFRLRLTDVEYSQDYVADFVDRNFTVGYRDKVDSYPYTWDFTDIQGFSSEAVDDEANNYPIAAAANDEYGDQWDISLFDENGYMKLNTGYAEENWNHIFDANKIGFGNQLWAGDDVIPETRGLWFYTDDNNFNYNDCLQITSEGISFCNAAAVDGHEPWWNYKMVVPDVPNDAAVYLRMKRDSRIADTDKMHSDIDNANVLFLNTRFHFGTSSSSNPKTSLTEDTQDVYLTQENGTDYSFYKVPGTNDEYILAVKNTTGATNHLTFTLNGWIVKKVAVSKDYKNIGTTGYATESRTRIIDHTLTEQLTGVPVKAYQAKLSDDGTKMNLAEVSYLAAATNEGDLTGCILHNETENDAKEVKVLNNGFHLFVPDMHDTSVDNLDNNVMMAHLNSNNVESSNNITSYVLSAKYYDKSQVGLPEKSYLGDGRTVAFYRVDPNSGARLAANSAYMQLEKSTQQARILMFFGDGFGDTPTAIETVESASEENGEWHNLNGQAIKTPVNAGIYIRNGKKVVVK